MWESTAFALRWKDIDEQARLLTVRGRCTPASSQRHRPKREFDGFRSRIRRWRCAQTGAGGPGTAAQV